ncbi:hypothetical protein ACFVUS_27200 [Nocardia sp. NPDC058058]|uniref:hypothetical protein n=1 Tax=Nocardia sp. NPDC058058 TaxID=3346317 RepID=UPI0036DEEFA7
MFSFDFNKIPTSTIVGAAAAILPSAIMRFGSLSPVGRTVMGVIGGAIGGITAFNTNHESSLSNRIWKALAVGAIDGVATWAGATGGAGKFLRPFTLRSGATTGVDFLARSIFSGSSSNGGSGSTPVGVPDKPNHIPIELATLPA